MKSACSSLSFVGIPRGEVVGLAEVFVDVVELPDVVGERASRLRFPRRLVHGRPRPSRRDRSRGCRRSRSTASCAGLPPSASSNVYTMLTPSIGVCFTPFTVVGSGIPAASSTVGAMSVTCWNWVRVSPFALMRAGQLHDQRIARAAEVRSDLLGPHERRVARHRPARGHVREGLRAAPLVEVLQLSGTVSATPLKYVISLNMPIMPPSALAPLSPTS